MMPEASYQLIREKVQKRRPNQGLQAYKAAPVKLMCASRIIDRPKS
jgi:hypothetical protein